MGDRTKIEWVQGPDGVRGATWNPVTGCTKVSPGCDHCYAEAIAERFRGTPAYPNGFELTLRPDRLDLPLRWTKPRMIFVNSMSDLFHAEIPLDYLSQVWDVMVRCPRHTFQVLTKRAERMERALGPRGIGFYAVDGPVPCPQPNIWLGTSVESPAYYSRIRHLQRTPAAVRFLSCEPLLAALPDLPLEGIDWVIVGGESGPRARPMHPDWVRGIRDQCVVAGVPLFFKQWGQFVSPEFIDTAGWDDVVANERGVTIWRDGRLAYGQHGTCIDGSEVLWSVGKKVAGHELDGREWREMPMGKRPALEARG